MNFKLMFLKAAVGFVVGFSTGFGIDLQTFRTYRKREQFSEFYWRIAAFRWFSGAAYGALSALGIAFGEGAGLLPTS